MGGGGGSGAVNGLMISGIRWLGHVRVATMSIKSQIAECFGPFWFHRSLVPLKPRLRGICILSLNQASGVVKEVLSFVAGVSLA